MENRILRARRAVLNLRRRCRWLLAARWTLMLSAAWIFFWGTLVLAWRAATGQGSPWLWTGALGLAAALALSANLSSRRTPSYLGLLALVERRNRAGGFLVASAERDLGAWGKQLGEYHLPRLKVQWKRPAAAASTACLFLMAAWLLPIPETPVRALLDIDRQSQELAQQIDVLEEEEIYRQEEAESLRRQMESLRKESDADDPARTYEALDHLQEQMEQSAQEAAQGADQAIESLTQAEELAGALSKAGDQLSSALQDQGGAELQEMLSQLSSMQNLSAKAGEWGQMSTEGLDPEGLQRLSAQLSSSKSELLQSMERLQQVRLIDARTLGRCKDGSKTDAEGLAAFLAENEKAILATGARCRMPGRGGVDRGRGDAWLSFEDEVAQEGFGFRDQSLPPSAVHSLEEAELVGMSSSAPVTDPGQVSSGGTLQSSQAGGGSAVRRTVLPRHRGAVERFFQRGQDPTGSSSQPPGQPR
ncbi:MAG TPA: hypothetical protein VLU25_21995 [Acidobacteriota bacterium]|nr:hypothetical protein [Acidobacteriota bacterium]